MFGAPRVNREFVGADWAAVLKKNRNRNVRVLF